MEKQSPTSWVRLFLIVATCCFLYALSCGPVYYFETKSKSRVWMNTVIYVAYWPLHAVTYKVGTPLRLPLEIYVRWWTQ